MAISVYPSPHGLERQQLRIVKTATGLFADMFAGMQTSVILKYSAREE